MEYWTEINLFADVGVQDEILLRVLWPYVGRLRKGGVLLSFHFFREPEIRFRLRLKNERERSAQTKAQERIANRLQKQGLISRWRFGNHGEEGKPYTGEEDRYGKNGWKVAQKYFEQGAETALWLLELKAKGRLESPLWAKGLGNPWEGGDKNPWREREENPLVYHWSRHLHLFTNQLGFNIDEEARLCGKQSERYRKISEELGMKW
jgi:hypothetical protein